MNIKVWDWKYKVFFDKNLYNELINYSLNLTNDEKEIFLNQLSFYKSFYTINILIDMIKETPANTNEYITIAKNNLSYCNKTKIILKDKICDRINGLNIGKNEKDDLRLILRYSLNSNLNVNYYDYLKISFNESDLNNIINLIKVSYYKTKKFDLDNKYLNSSDKNIILSFYEKSIKDIHNSKSLTDRFGIPSNDCYDILVENKSGHGEWWDKDLYDKYKNDTLIICQNSSNTTDDYFYTFIHEIYPGHRHFFKSVKNTNTCIDTGALLLIEGFATYTEINSIHSNYSNNLRHNYSNFILKILENKLDELSLDNIYISNQYVGYRESYYFGAFAIEYFINQKYIKELDFLNDLKKRNKGDFFKLW